jgi:hypothetical protein
MACRDCGLVSVLPRLIAYSCMVYTTVGSLWLLHVDDAACGDQVTVFISAQGQTCMDTQKDCTGLVTLRGWTRHIGCAVFHAWCIGRQAVPRYFEWLNTTHQWCSDSCMVHGQAVLRYACRTAWGVLGLLLQQQQQQSCTTTDCLYVSVCASLQALYQPLLLHVVTPHTFGGGILRPAFITVAKKKLSDCTPGVLLLLVVVVVPRYAQG